MTKQPLKILLILIALAAIGILGYSAWMKSGSQPGVTGSDSIEYRNEQYGFSVTLPKTWQGYTVSVDKWTGYASGDQLGETVFTDGPVVSIHNPKWTPEHMYQDIPIMVFTFQQWNDLQADKFHIGAAPINPSELGQNVKYVFALPARYNYAFPPGWEEVEQILQGKPLKAF
jgi:hypothetical protein